MKSLSVAANLSAMYTNHCLRATCTTALDQAGIEARHIMSVSGQKSEASIRSYSRYVSDAKKHEMSHVLSAHMIDLPREEEESASSSNTALALSVSTTQTHSSNDECLSASQLELSLNMQTTNDIDDLLCGNNNKAHAPSCVQFP